MRERRKSQISDSEDSEASLNLRDKLNINSVNINNVSNSENTSDSDTSGKPSAPPEPSPRRKEGSRSPKKTVTFNPLDKFVSENEGLARVIINDLISEDDDICILEVPKTIDPDDLMDKCIKFHKKTKIKVNNTKYVVKPSGEDIKPVNLLMDKLKILHPIAILKLHEYTKSKNESEALNVGTCTPALPQNLKVRHPLFGTEYKHKIVLDENIQKKLDNVIDKAVKKMEKKKKRFEEQHSLESPFPVKEKKKKKKKKGDEQQLEENHVDESIFALLETHIAANKRKNNMRDEEANLESNLEDSVTEHKKKKKKKKNKHKVKEEVEELSSDSKERESFFEHKKKSPKKKHDEKQYESFADDFEDDSQRKRKSSIHHGNTIEERQYESFAGPSDYEDHSERKRKNSVKQEKCKSMNENRARDNSFSIEDSRFNQSEPVLGQVKEEKRKRKNSMKREESFREDTEKKSKRNSLANSTIIPGLQLPLFEFDVSGIMMNKEHNREDPEVENKLQKLKKKKTQSFENEEIDNGTETSYDDSSTKKRRKKHEADDENNGSSTKKKRKKVKEEPVEESEDDETKNSLIQDLLSKVKSEFGSSVKLKKKKKGDR